MPASFASGLLHDVLHDHLGDLVGEVVFGAVLDYTLELEVESLHLGGAEGVFGTGVLAEELLVAI